MSLCVCVSLPGAGHCAVKAVIVLEEKMGLGETPLPLGLCITLGLILHKEGRAMWVEQGLFPSCSCGSSSFALQEGFLCCCSQRVVEGLTGWGSWAVWVGCWN